MREVSATKFKVLLAAGFLLGVLLLIEAVWTYYYVAAHLVVDHLRGEAGRFISLLENRTQESNPPDVEQLRSLLDEMRQEYTDEIAWLRVADQQGGILALTGDTDEQPLPAETLEALLGRREQNVADFHSTPGGEALAVVMPFRFRFAAERTVSKQGTVGVPRFKLAEVALYLHGAADPFRPLRRNLVISIVAGLALVVSMLAFGLLLGSYLHGRELEHQAVMARRIQQQLLPAACPDCSHLDLAAVCTPAWEVGGDYYNVFKTSQGQVGLVLADVSGKGLPAALVMGIVHGAVHAFSSRLNDATTVSEMIRDLNELLLDRTPTERFVSLFWGLYDPARRVLRYVNAGHPAPLVVRHGDHGNGAVERLTSGGPVLGLLPGLTFEEGETGLSSGDLLVLFTDGVIEATNPAGVEFDEKGLLAAIQSAPDGTARDIHQEILRRVKAFAGGTALADDLTLVAARIRTVSPAVKTA